MIAKLSAKKTPTQIQEQIQYLHFCWLWWAAGQCSIRQIKYHFHQGSCLSASLCKFSISSDTFRGKPQSLSCTISRSLSSDSGVPNWGEERLLVTGAACAHICPCPWGALLQLPHPPTSGLSIWGIGYAGGLEMGTEPSITVEKRHSCIHCTIPSDLFKTAKIHKRTQMREQYSHQTSLNIPSCLILCANYFGLIFHFIQHVKTKASSTLSLFAFVQKRKRLKIRAEMHTHMHIFASISEVLQTCLLLPFLG